MWYIYTFQSLAGNLDGIIMNIVVVKQAQLSKAMAANSTDIK